MGIENVHPYRRTLTDAEDVFNLQFNSCSGYTLLGTQQQGNATKGNSERIADVNTLCQRCGDEDEGDTAQEAVKFLLYPNSLARIRVLDRMGI